MPLVELRRLSNLIFGRDHQFEVAQAVAVLDPAIGAEDVIDEVRRRSAAEDGGRPSEATVRKCLERLELMGAVRSARSGRVGVADVWLRQDDSPFWRWLQAIAPRAPLDSSR
jgi:hypothetical protein